MNTEACHKYSSASLLLMILNKKKHYTCFCHDLRQCDIDLPFPQNRVESDNNETSFDFVFDITEHVSTLAACDDR